MGSEIEIKVWFIRNSLAMGCIVVLQPDDGSPDEFRVLQLSGSDLTLTDKISVPPSVYTAYVYDLELNKNIDISANIHSQVNVMEGMLNTHVQSYMHGADEGQAARKSSLPFA